MALHHHQLQHHHHLPDGSHYNRNQALINSSPPILPNPMSALTQLNLQVSRGALPHGSPSPPGSKSATPSPSSSNQEEEAEAHLKVLMRLQEFCSFIWLDAPFGWQMSPSAMMWCRWSIWKDKNVIIWMLCFLVWPALLRCQQLSVRSGSFVTHDLWFTPQLKRCGLERVRNGLWLCAPLTENQLQARCVKVYKNEQGLLRFLVGGTCVSVWHKRHSVKDSPCI